MKKVTLLLVLLSLMFSFAGCESEEEYTKDREMRFSCETVYDGMSLDIMIFTDKETGKQFVVYDGSYSGGIVAYE